MTNTNTGRWKPILDGELADRAWRAVHAIADGIALLREPAGDLVVFWSYAAATFGDDLSAAREADAHAHFAEALARGASRLGLYGGLAGLGWTAAHVLDDADDLLALVDRTIIDELERATPWQGQYDLIDGLVGLGVYFLEREPGPAATRGLQLVVDHLAGSARASEAGTTWYTPAALIPPSQRNQFPSGYFNCGLAHGVAGIVALLAKICTRADAPPAAAQLRDDAARWLRAQRLGAAGFPACHDGTPRTGTRAAWCYGDPGVTVALWSVAARTASPTTDIGALVTDWLAREHHGVVDAPLCHGAAGLAHLGNRFYQASADERYRDAARTWFERTLDLQREGEALGGFLAYTTPAGDTPAHWRPAPDLLDGAIGVGLALLAALTPLEPEWDRIMLCDLPIA